MKSGINSYNMATTMQDLRHCFRLSSYGRGHSCSLLPSLPSVAHSPANIIFLDDNCQGAPLSYHQQDKCQLSPTWLLRFLTTQDQYAAPLAPILINMGLISCPIACLCHCHWCFVQNICFIFLRYISGIFSPTEINFFLRVMLKPYSFHSTFLHMK